MANSFRIARVNYADAAVLSTGSEINSLPIANLKDADIQVIWRSASGTSSQLIVLVDLGQTQTIGAVALMNCNVFTPATFRVRVSTADATGVAGDAYDQSGIGGIVDPIYPTFVHFIEPTVSGRYVRIDASGLTSAPEAGRLAIADVWAPSRHMSYGWEPLWRDHSISSRSLGGNEFVDVRDRQRGFRFRIRGLTQSEAQTHVDALNRERGIGRDILVCRDKDNSDLGQATIWGLLAEPVRQRQTHPDFYEIECEVWERN